MSSTLWTHFVSRRLVPLKNSFEHGHWLCHDVYYKLSLLQQPFQVSCLHYSMCMFCSTWHLAIKIHRLIYCPQSKRRERLIYCPQSKRRERLIYCPQSKRRERLIYCPQSKRRERLIYCPQSKRRERLIYCPQSKRRERLIYCPQSKRRERLIYCPQSKRRERLIYCPQSKRRERLIVASCCVFAAIVEMYGGRLVLSSLWKFYAILVQSYRNINLSYL